MEWVETTGKTLEEAKDVALDRLGVAADEAEFEVLEEPRAGLFGRMRGEARVRARVKPTAVRPKQDRRNRGRGKRSEGRTDQRGQGSKHAEGDDESSADGTTDDQDASESTARSGRQQSGRDASSRGNSKQAKQPKQKEQKAMSNDEQSTVTPEEVGAAAEAFMNGLAAAIGATGETTVDIDGSDIEVRLDGAQLGLLVGHGGRTLSAVQDLARVASQRRLGDHETRLRIDVGGYREKRREALERFARAVADEVIASGEAKALEPMQSADRKIVHDALNDIEGVVSRSEGDDPSRRVVIEPS